MKTRPEGTVVYWSQGAQATFGYTSAEAVGHSLQELLVPPNGRSERCHALPTKFEPGSNDYICACRKKDGSVVQVHVRCNADGALAYLDVASTAGD